MKNLLLLMLIVVAATACKKEDPSNDPNTTTGFVTEKLYLMTVESPNGQSLLDNPNVENSVKTQQVRLRYYNTNNQLAQFVYSDAPRSYRTGSSVYGYDYMPSNGKMVFEIVPNNPYNFLQDIPKGYSTLINYIDWPNGTSDKIEAKILRFGQVIRIVELKVNDSFVLKKENEQHCTISPHIKKIVDRDNIRFEKGETTVPW